MYSGFARRVVRLLLLSGAFHVCTAQAPAKTSLPLWPGAVPLATGDAAPDRPSIDVYLPQTNPTHTGVLVIPGGGYGYLAAHEGEPVALWLQAHGVAAFVLRYRVAPYHYPAEMLDGLRAMRLARANASQYGIDTSKLGVWGFSAGGHLAAYLMTQFAARLAAPADATDAVSARPDFGVLSYAVISMRPEITHHGSHENLLGPAVSADAEEQLSNELHVTKDAPPAFLYATSDDGVVPVQNSVRFYEAYVEQKLPVEMHLFEHGPHGSVLAQKLVGASAWPGLLATWLTRHGWMAAQP